MTKASAHNLRLIKDLLMGMLHQSFHPLDDAGRFRLESPTCHCGHFFDCSQLFLL